MGGACRPESRSTTCAHARPTSQFSEHPGFVRPRSLRISPSHHFSIFDTNRNRTCCNNTTKAELQDHYISTMEVEFELSQSLTSDGQGVRAIGIIEESSSSSSLDQKPSADRSDAVDTVRLVTGTQGGTVMEYGLPSASLEPWSSGQHDAAVTAICTVRSNVANNTVMVVTGSKDAKVRLWNGTTRQLIGTLEGHDKAVTSLSCWKHFVVSGSWDGTAKVWNVQTRSLIATLPNHENSVSVALIPPTTTTTDETVLQIVTGSAGLAQNNQIRDHAVRMFHVNTHTGHVQSVYHVANDHEGPIRDVSLVSMGNDTSTLLATCSNDGTVKLRAVDTGKCTSTLTFVPSSSSSEQQPPMLLSVCATTDGCVVASAEDGHVIVWDLMRPQQPPQLLLHTACVWRVEALSNGDFATATDHGMVRIFTRATQRMALHSERQAFSQQAAEAAAAAQQKQQSGGPSAEEIAKLPLWEQNLQRQGKSEGQVQVFNKNGIAIAAQWSMASQTWIEVGQVMGTNNNNNNNNNSPQEIDGVRYDHVLPVEVEQSGSVVHLKIGYNTGENPFVAAQRFIDAHMLPQYQLRQIAEYIQQRTGASATPTLGMDPLPAATTGMPMVSYQYLPMAHALAFELPSTSPQTLLGKIQAKLQEFGTLTPDQASRLNTLVETLQATNRYHASTVSEHDISLLMDLWTALEDAQRFVVLDLARITMLHPTATAAATGPSWTRLMHDHVLPLLQTPSRWGTTAALPMLSLRLLTNALKAGGAARQAILTTLVDPLLAAVSSSALVASPHKTVRGALATLLYNLAWCWYHQTKQDNDNNNNHPTASSVQTVVELVGTILTRHRTAYDETAMLRLLQALGTTCLAVPSVAKPAAQALGLASQVEPAASPHGPNVKAAAKEVYQVLQ